jgi:hypothetical protein
MRRWGPAAVVVVLLAGTAIAFATTERQKLEQTPIGLLRVTKDFSPSRSSAVVVLRLRHSHILTVQIVNSADHAVATLAREQDFRPGKATFRWRGRHVPDGIYEPRVTLEDEGGRVFNLPNQIRVDSVAPSVKLVSYRPRILRRRHKPLVHIFYRVSELAHVILYVDGRRVAFSYAKATQAHIEWYAKRHGRRLRRGRYRLELAPVDLAGNVGVRTPAFFVRVR